MVLNEEVLCERLSTYHSGSPRWPNFALQATIVAMKLTDIRNINWRRVYYHLRYEYMTLNNAVIALAAIIALAWVWGSISVMQRNYELQRKVDARERQATLAELEVEMLEYEQRYYESNEFQELSARQYLGLANPGEKLLILPENTEAAKAVGAENDPAVVQAPRAMPSNFEQWMDFFGGRNLSDE